MKMMEWFDDAVAVLPGLDELMAAELTTVDWIAGVGIGQ